MDSCLLQVGRLARQNDYRSVGRNLYLRDLDAFRAGRYSSCSV
jgi:hypothetical protein